MRKVVVDTNLVFSTILDRSSPVGTLVTKPEDYGIELCALDMLKVELTRHAPKLRKILSVTATVLQKLQATACSRITFVPDATIPYSFYTQALPFVRDTDIDDIAFVALALWYNCELVTGDRKLQKGLMARGYRSIFSFTELRQSLMR